MDGLYFYGAGDEARLHFRWDENYGCHQCLHWWRKQSTGLFD